MSIPSWAKVGAKVVCIKDTTSQIVVPANSAAWDGATKGNVYTVTGVLEQSPLSGFPVLLLDGFHKRHYHRLSRFRPVKTIEDDISEHFAILLRTPSKVDA